MEGVGVVGAGWIANAASATGITDVVADVAEGVAAVVMAHVAEAAEIVTVNVDVEEEYVVVAAIIVDVIAIC